ncbi:MAG: DUF2203 domain-containing protein [Acidobacteriaceae bacterium]
MDFEKHFTLDEAQSLLPVLESLLKRAVEARRAAGEIEEEHQELTRKVFLLGGMFLDVDKMRKRRAAYEAQADRMKDSLAEIDSIGVEVKDLESGLLDFPCLIDGETVLLCWKMGESRIEFWHTLESGFAGRRPLDARFTKKAGRRERPN